jgi:D-amino-acid dehydrogenase
VIHAFGHGHIGLTLAPITGRIVADLVRGAAPKVDITPFLPTRF